MRISVRHSIGDLSSDMQHIARTAQRDMVGVVKEGLRVGNTVAKDYAKVSAGAHGKHYHKAFSWEMRGISGGFGVYGISGEYGPDAAKRQGNMSFEWGSRNQPAHLDLNRSADLIGPSFGQEVRRLPDGWFWPA